MDSFNTCEYTVAQKTEGKWLAFKILAVVAYVAYAVAYFVAIYITKLIPLGALIPVTLWVIVFFTWRYVSPEYKYVIESGKLIFTVIYGSRTEKKRTVIKISAAKAIAPKDALLESVAKFAPERVYSAIPSKKASGAYAVLYFDDRGKRCVFYFMPAANALKLLHFYNSDTVITETEL